MSKQKLLKKLGQSFRLFTLTFLIFFPLGSLAYDDEKILPEVLRKEVLNSSDMSDSEVDRRTQLVLRHFQIEPEASFSDLVAGFNKKQSLAGFNSLLPYFSPDNSILKFLKLDVDSLVAYQDMNSKLRLDFKVQLSKEKSESQHLGSATDFFVSRPLSGLRIVIDPGHMGSDFWDIQTGKFIKDANGNKLSEGVLNLQTSILLKQELEDLGAEVRLTHEGLHPVSEQAWDKFDLNPVAKNELRESVHANWFLNLVSAPVSDQQMLQNFENSDQLKRLFSERSRSDYFIKRLDLWARADFIESFKPDLVLIIHYDVAESKAPSSLGSVNPKSPRQTKAFVVGGHQKDEIGSRKNRAYMIRHILDRGSFANSVRLSKLITSKLSKDLDLSLATSADEETYLIQPGIFARNLVVPRYLTSAAVSYLECLFYDNPMDFYKLSQKQHDLLIDGKNYPYSDHLIKIVTAIRNGVMEYAKQVKD